ncbi:hypothetical protein V6N13_125316 [Hibiscus sabdariffa]|uniref:Uncharacterized protein n=1 Tax=Hibiscus sabdariffa TaxID=183260 RepID=A0ABR2U5L2_9ROSI
MSEQMVADVVALNNVPFLDHAGTDPTLNTSSTAAMLTTLMTNKIGTIVVDTVVLNPVNVPIFPTKATDDIDKDMGKSFLSTASVMFEFKELVSKESPSHAVPSDKGTMVLVSRGTKRRSPCMRIPNTKNVDPYHLLQKIKLG